MPEGEVDEMEGKAGTVISMGEMGVRGESGGSDVLRLIGGEEGSMGTDWNAGDEGADASDALRGLSRIPPRGAVSTEVKEGLGGMRRDVVVGEIPKELMGW